jgi:hypothetical protein
MEYNISTDPHECDIISPESSQVKVIAIKLGYLHRRYSREGGYCENFECRNAEGCWGMGTLINASLARVWHQGLASEHLLASAPYIVSRVMIIIRSIVSSGDRHFTARKCMQLGYRQMKYPKRANITAFSVLFPSGIPRPEVTIRVITKVSESWFIPRPETCTGFRD